MAKEIITSAIERTRDRPTVKIGAQVNKEVARLISKVSDKTYNEVHYRTRRAIQNLGIRDFCGFVSSYGNKNDYEVMSYIFGYFMTKLQDPVEFFLPVSEDPAKTTAHGPETKNIGGILADFDFEAAKKWDPEIIHSLIIALDVPNWAKDPMVAKIRTELTPLYDVVKQDSKKA